MAITATLVKELRERTGAGMMECKKALTEADGDMDAAIEILRKKGTAKADKRADKIAAEGTIACVNDGAKAALVEVNCETDFVAKEDDFVSFANAVAVTVNEQQPDSVDALNAMTLYGGNITVEAARTGLITKIGENITVRRFSVMVAQDGEKISDYVHTGSRIAVLVHSRGGRDDLGRDIAMHIAHSKPLCINKEGVPEELVAKERTVAEAQAKESGKPANIIEKMVEGKLQKFLNEVSLMGQAFVKDPDQTIEKLLKSEKAEVLAFVRYEVGEGIEKKKDDFVAEVMAQAKGA